MKIEGLGGPEEGHTFEVSFRSRGSYSVTGDAGPTDAPDFDGPPRSVQVRAWNLRDALRKAAALPLDAWFSEDWFPEEIKPGPTAYLQGDPVYFRGSVPNLRLLPRNTEVGTDIGDAWIVESVSRIARWDGYRWRFLDNQSIELEPEPNDDHSQER